MTSRLTPVAIPMPLVAMRAANEVFVELIVAILNRYCRQNEWRAPGENELSTIATKLAALVATRGVPLRNPLGPENPPEMKAEDVAPLVAAILEGLDCAGQLAVPVRQLVKTCFQEERRVCRDSYRETTRDGICRRQQLDRVRSRVSGSHCVDCPYWNELDEPAHAELLAGAWCDAPEQFAGNRAIFLPEDFRALRRWLRARAEENALGANV